MQRYSLLDKDAMGLVDQTQVPSVLLRREPHECQPTSRCHVQIQKWVSTFSGTPRAVTIDDSLRCTVNELRRPRMVPRLYRGIYIVSAGRTVDPAAIEKLDRIRAAWDRSLPAATDSWMRAETRLSLWTSTR